MFFFPVLNIEGPQGCVLTPVLFLLFFFPLNKCHFILKSFRDLPKRKLCFCFYFRGDCVFAHLLFVFWQALNCAAAIGLSSMAHMQRLKSQGHYTMDLSQTNIMKVWIFMDKSFCMRVIQTGPGAIWRHYCGGFCHGVLCLTERKQLEAASNHSEEVVLNLRHWKRTLNRERASPPHTRKVSDVNGP